MTYECELLERPALLTLSIRAKTAVQDLPAVLGKGYGEIAQYLFEIGEQPAGAPFTAYYNMDMASLEIELGFPVAKKLPGKGEIRSGEIPSGKVATCMFKGPYGEMPPAYEALSRFMNEKGVVPVGVVYEMYFNAPDQTPPSELLTQIMFPVK